MCWCGKCMFANTSKCKGEQHVHLIDENILSNEVSRFINELSRLTDTPLDDIDTLNFLKHFSSIQILKKNEALSNVSMPPQYNDTYFSFCSSLIKQYNTDFYLKNLKFHYIFNANSSIHGFLNNYLNIELNSNVIGAIYECGSCFRAKGETEFTENNIFAKASYTDYFAVFIKSNVILFDLANNKAHVVCQTDEVESIVNLMNTIDIILTNRTFRSFEGMLELKTNVLLFRHFMSYYLQIPVIGKEWLMKSPEKSVNDYIFRLRKTLIEQSDTNDNDDNPEVNISGKIYEYVRMSIEPVKKVDMINNIFRISFIGNDKALLVPFIASLIALIMKLETSGSI